MSDLDYDTEDVVDRLKELKVEEHSETKIDKKSSDRQKLQNKGVASSNAEATGLILPNYGSNTSSYVEEIEEGGFFRIEALKGKVYIETYSADYKLLSTKKLSMNCLNLEDILKVKMHGISCLDRITMNRIIQKKLSGLSNMMMTGINLDSAV